MTTPLVTMRQSGETIDYTPGSAVTAGDVVVLGSMVCVAERDIDASVKGQLTIKGVARFPKAVDSSSALSAGTKVYWDASGEVVTTTEASNKVAGYTVPKDGESTVAAAAADATVDVDLCRA